VALGQLFLQRTTTGGRGILLSVGRIGIQTVHENLGTKTDGYRVDVTVAGPGVWHEVAVHLEIDGHEFHAVNRPGSRPAMSCESEPIAWNLDLTRQVADEVWCVVTWAAPSGPTLRTAALATPLRAGGAIYQWRWFIGFRYLEQLSEFASHHGPDWFRDRFGRPRPLGRWKKFRGAPLRDGNGPLGLGRTPNASRWHIGRRQCSGPAGSRPPNFPEGAPDRHLTRRSSCFRPPVNL